GISHAAKIIARTVSHPGGGAAESSGTGGAEGPAGIVTHCSQRVVVVSLVHAVGKGRGVEVQTVEGSLDGIDLETHIGIGSHAAAADAVIKDIAVIAAAAADTHHLDV